MCYGQVHSSCREEVSKQTEIRVKAGRCSATGKLVRESRIRGLGQNTDGPPGKQMSRIRKTKEVELEPDLCAVKDLGAGRTGGLSSGTRRPVLGLDLK